MHGCLRNIVPTYYKKLFSDDKFEGAFKLPKDYITDNQWPFGD